MPNSKNARNYANNIYKLLKPHPKKRPWLKASWKENLNDFIAWYLKHFSEGYRHRRMESLYYNAVKPWIDTQGKDVPRPAISNQKKNAVVNADYSKYDNLEV